jgi:hypothetical protein
MAQTLFTTVQLNSASAANIYVKVGFVPARIELINLTQLQTPTATNGYKALWQQGMAQPSAIVTKFYSAATTPAVSLVDQTSYITTGGISLLNPLGAEQGQYGAVASGFTNANPGVITVDSTYSAGITAGCIIRVSLVADNQAGTQDLNGDYYVASVTATTVTLGTAPAGLWTQTTLSSPNTTGFSVYVSGGVVTVLQNANATVPNPPHNIYSNVPSWYNEAIQGFIIGTSTFANATYSATVGDTILVAAWDAMNP